MSKVYTSKSGNKFAITAIPKPPENGLVYFTEDEWLWMKGASISTEEFDYLWNLKLEDFRAQIIPDKNEKECVRLAKQYGEKILQMLKGGVSD